MRHQNDRGQSVVEYLVLFAAVLVVLFVFLRPNKSIFQKSAQEVYNAGTESMEGYANTIFKQ